MTSPIPLSEFEASVRDPNSALFFPALSYRSDAFHRFEIEAVWQKEWISVGRVEEIPTVGDYFSVELWGEPVLIVRAAADEIVALSAVCRHRGMLVAQGKGHCRHAFVCPYHGWSYDVRGKLVAAPQMEGIGTFDRDATSLPRLKVTLWHGFIFVTFNDDTSPLAARLAPLDPLMAAWSIGDLRGESTLDPNYKQTFDYPWNWKVYADGVNECYHCEYLHRDTPIIQALEMPTIEYPLVDPDAGIFQLQFRARHIDATLNHTGRSIFPPIPSLSLEQRWLSHSVVIAPNIFMQLMADSVIVLTWWPTSATSMRAKRNRLYPTSTLDLANFAHLHREESVAGREFVSQDNFVFERVQIGLQSHFAPRGPVSQKERVVVAFNRWLVDRYRAAERNSPRSVEAG